ncbi:MAG: Fur family transcriptional regulator [Dehalococcoidia bacterium]|nr:Fur family transcriptional regulator [Dehalococcoidia bacterium]HCU99643.1 transcriptional repressor [Dehalococcoidia bacterium]|tara:strand:- start:8437 stop:8871 length:435 start_codon:yes stop_codon:yes gene_type:complete
MACEQETATTLREAGFRVTPQRLLVASALRHAGRHLSASEIAEEVRKVYPVVDLSTVYRTVEMLRRLGLATATDMGGDDLLFEWSSGEAHHHLICSGCRKMQVLDHTYLDGLAEEVSNDFGFEADLQHFAIFGLCKTCREKPTS